MMYKRTMILIKSIALSLFFVLSLLQTPVYAQNANPQNKVVPENELPINIESDSASFDEKNNQATHKGHVILTQGSRKLYADKLIIYRNNAGKLVKIEAFGSPAKFQAKPLTDKPVAYGQGNILRYFPDKDLLRLLGQGELKQNDDTIRGADLSYQIVKRVLTSNPAKGSRTHIILNPESFSPSKKT